MSYISHVDYKKMMDGFKKGAPKKMLQEDLEQEGNAFTAGLAKSKKGQEFKVGNKAVKDTSNYDSSMEEEMHTFDDIKIDTPHAHKLKVKTPNFSGTIFKNEDGTYVFYDVDNYNADPSLPPFKTITDLMKHFGIKMQDLHEDEMEEASYTDNYEGSWGYREGEMEESHPGMDKWYEDFENGLQNLVKNGYIHKNQYQYFHDALDHVDPMQNYGHMPAHDAAKEFVDDLRTKDAIDHEEDQWKQEHGGYDGGGDDFNDGEFWENEVKKLQEIAGVGPHDDGPEDDDTEEREHKAKKAEMDDEEAENAEREDEGVEKTNDGSHMRSEEEAARVVAQKHPELKQLYDKYEATKEEYAQMTKTPNYANTPEFQAFSKERNAIWKKFENDAINWAGHEMLEAGMSKVQVRNLLSAYGYFEDWVPDYLQALSNIYKSGDMEEGLHMPPLQATGPTVDTNEGMHMPPLQATGNSAVKEDQAPFGMSVLSPDERKQLKEFIESYKTIKKEIASLLEKAGKDPRIMENAKRMGDEAVPAERPAHYNEPTKTPRHNPSNLGGNRTGLVMTKAEMWEEEGHEEDEHERIESMLDTKLHDAFHKVTGMIMKDLMDDGFDGGDIKNFLQHEIEERAKEAAMSQYDPH